MSTYRGASLGAALKMSWQQTVVLGTLEKERLFGGESGERSFLFSLRNSDLMSLDNYTQTLENQKKIN